MVMKGLIAFWGGIVMMTFSVFLIGLCSTIGNVPVEVGAVGAGAYEG